VKVKKLGNIPLTEGAINRIRKAIKKSREHWVENRNIFSDNIGKTLTKIYEEQSKIKIDGVRKFIHIYGEGCALCNLAKYNRLTHGKGKGTLGIYGYPYILKSSCDYCIINFLRLPTCGKNSWVTFINTISNTDLVTRQLVNLSDKIIEEIDFLSKKFERFVVYVHKR